MKKLLCTIVFLFAANYASAQNYFTTTTSATNSNSNLSHFGTFTLGSTFENLIDPWRTGQGRLLELYKPSGNVSFRLGNAFGKLSFNIAGHNGAFFPSVHVIRKHTADKVYFSLNTSGGTGDNAFIFRDATNRQTLSILNNGKVGIGTTSPSTKLHVSSSTSGDAVLKLEADTDNNNEGDNARIELLQDGNSLGAIIGFNQDFAANSDSGNLFRIATRFDIVNATATPVSLTLNASVSNTNYTASQSIVLKHGCHAISNVELKIVSDNSIPNQGSTTYYDGLGKAKQQIEIGQSPDENDIIQHIEYDEFGRVSLQFLPHEVKFTGCTYR